MSLLPLDLLLFTLQFLDFPEICAVKRVSKTFENYSNRTLLRKTSFHDVDLTRPFGDYVPNLNKLKILKKYCPKLTELAVHCDPSALELIGEVLKSCPNLTALFLAGTHYKSVLLQCAGLTKLRKFKVHPAPGKLEPLVGDCLERLIELKSVAFTLTGLMPDDGLQALGRLERLRNIEELHISDFEFRLDPFKQLSINMMNLKTFSFQGSFGDEACEAVAAKAPNLQIFGSYCGEFYGTINGIRSFLKRGIDLHELRLPAYARRSGDRKFKGAITLFSDTIRLFENPRNFPNLKCLVLPNSYEDSQLERLGNIRGECTIYTNSRDEPYAANEVYKSDMFHPLHGYNLS